MAVTPSHKSSEVLPNKAFKNDVVKDNDRILDYIGHMTLELAQLAGRSGCESLGHDLITLAEKAKAQSRACRDDRNAKTPLTTDHTLT